MAQELKDTSLYADANLKAYYRFESGALTTDSTTGGHTLTAISDPAEVAGKFGGGVDLDGNDAYSATDHADFKPTGAFSVGGWVKTTGGAQTIIHSYSENSNVAGWHLSVMADGKVQFVSGKNSGTTQNTDWKNVISTSVVNNNVWHSVVGVSDGTYLRIYIDGVENATPVSWANAPAYAATNYVRVGMLKYSASEIWFLTGSLDDLFLLNGTALTATQVANLYDRGIKKINGVYMGSQEIASTRFAGDANAVAYYRFEGNSTDETANNNDGTDTATTYGTAYGKFGQGALFNGSTSKIITGVTNLPTGANARTLSLWIYKTTTDVDVGYGYGKSTAPFTSTVFGFYINNLRLNFWAYNDDVDTGIDITLNKWEHVVFTYDGTSIIPYLNGNAGTPITKTLATLAQTSFFGANALASSNYWHGYIDDAAIFSRALTYDEITSIYKTGVKKLNGVGNIMHEIAIDPLGSDANLVSYWKMEDVNDSKGSNNLTNNGTATFIAGKFTNGVNLVATSSQYLSIADASQTGLDLTGDFSFSFWVKFTALPANGAEFTLICKDNTTTQRNFNTSIYNNAGTYRWYLDTFGNVGTESVYWNFNPTVGVWYLINFTYDVSEATATSGGFYINGVSQGASTTAATNNNTSLNNCTAAFQIGFRSSSYLNGMFDDVAVFTKVITATEISNLYNTNIKKYNGISNV